MIKCKVIEAGCPTDLQATLENALTIIPKCIDGFGMLSVQRPELYYSTDNGLYSVLIIYTVDPEVKDMSELQQTDKRRKIKQNINK